MTDQSVLLHSDGIPNSSDDDTLAKTFRVDGDKAWNVANDSLRDSFVHVACDYEMCWEFLKDWTNWRLCSDHGGFGAAVSGPKLQGTSTDEVDSENTNLFIVFRSHICDKHEHIAANDGPPLSQP